MAEINLMLMILIKKRVIIFDHNLGEETAKLFQKGLYLHGEVGTGKTLLLDLFYNSVPISEKKRVHFNMFMLYLYSEVNQWNLCFGTDKAHFVTPSQHIANKILAVIF